MGRPLFLSCLFMRWDIVIPILFLRWDALIQILIITEMGRPYSHLVCLFMRWDVLIPILFVFEMALRRRWPCDADGPPGETIFRKENMLG